MSRTAYADSSATTLQSFIDNQTEPVWMTDLRTDALSRAGEMNWPTVQDEEFRRSDVGNYNFDEFAFETEADRVVPEEIPAGLSGSLTFDGGSLKRSSLSGELAQKGVVFTSFQQAFAGEYPEKVLSALEATLRAGMDNADNRISVFHYAAITHGAFLYVPRFIETSEPFVVTFEESGDGLLRVPQIVVVTETGARVSVVQRVIGANEGEVLMNEAVDVQVGESGEVKFFGMQNLNFDSSCFSVAHASVGNDARFEHYNGLFGGMFAKYRVDADLNGRGSDAFLGGVYFPTQDQHVDMRTVQRHISPGAHSDALYKGAVSDEARSVYQGLIHVFHDAVGSDAYLTNNNLILSQEGRADSLPTLEIQTDDVRCSHGSTTGKLDPAQLYYLGTRGYSPEEARRMLVSGYFEAILSRYPETISEEVHRILDERITDGG